MMVTMVSQHSTAQHSTAQHSTAQHSTVIRTACPGYNSSQVFSTIFSAPLTKHLRFSKFPKLPKVFGGAHNKTGGLK